MADSARRSGRATKGQHSKKELEPDDTPTQKKGARGRKAKNEPSPPQEIANAAAIIRCICGTIVEDEDDPRAMIACEACDAWQHNECMEVSSVDTELPEKYYCEQCRPRDHKGLLEKVSRGERPWDDRARQRVIEEEEKKARKGKGRKGKRGRPSVAKKEDIGTNGAAAIEDMNMQIEDGPEEDGKEAVNEAPEEAAPELDAIDSNKRKLMEEPQTPLESQNQMASNSYPFSKTANLMIYQEPANKVRKISSPTNATKLPMSTTLRRKSGTAVATTKRDSNAAQLQTELVDDISELHSADRKRVAAAFNKLFVEQTRQAQKDGSFGLPEGQSEDAYGLKLALAVEYAIYLNFWGTGGSPSDPYKDKMKAILHNVKANPSLRDRLLSGDLSPNELSKMTREDMASDELKQQKEEMKKDAEKQHMLIHEDGPRIRRTHKGEEIVGDETHVADGAESAFTAPIRKRPSEIDTTMKETSPAPPSDHKVDAVELPENIAASPITAPPLVIDTKASPQPSAAPERKSSSNFDITAVWSGVKAPDPETQRVKQTPKLSGSSPNVPKQQADADIDQLLKDEEPEDDEPYSPVDFTAEPGSAVWHGKMTMAGVASFSGKAKHVAGADLSNKGFPWPHLISHVLEIEGRIVIDRATEYLCGLRYSNTTDVVVVSVTPSEAADDVAQFDKLFRYFTERSRYGVVKKSSEPLVKDIYVVPLEAGTSKKPEFVELLEVCTLEDPTPERMLLLTFVVKSNHSPSAQQTPRPSDAGLIASPVGAGGGQSGPPGPLGQHPGFQHSPTPYPFPQAQSQFGGSPGHGQQSYGLSQQPSDFSHQRSHGNDLIGIDAARHVLGELANCPVVEELLQKAPGTGVSSFLEIKQMLIDVPATRTNTTLLHGMLNQKILQQQSH